MMLRVPSVVHRAPGMSGLGACVDGVDEASGVICDSGSGTDTGTPVTLTLPGGSTPVPESTGSGSPAFTPQATQGVSMQACSAAGGVVLSDSTGALQCYSAPPTSGGVPLAQSGGAYVPLSPLTSFLNNLTSQVAPITRAITGSTLPTTQPACVAAGGTWSTVTNTCSAASNVSTGLLFIGLGVLVLVMVGSKGGR